VFTRGGAVRVWQSRKELDAAFERNVPWCSTCAIADVEAV